MYKRINELLGTEYKSDSEINWKDISVNYNLNEDFIEEFKDKLDWCSISYFQPLTEEFMRKYKNDIDWYFASSSQIFTSEFMEELEYCLNWWVISCTQPFIDIKVNKKVNLDALSCNIRYKKYQETKERGWFVGIVNKSYFGDYFYDVLEEERRYKIYSSFDKYIKARIYWKDLIMVDRIKKFNFIRLFKIL